MTTHDVFISYSTRDKPVADAACATLESHGIRCWIAPRDVLPGTDWGESIIRAISSARLMVLIFSSHANASAQVKREVERAGSKGVPILPFRVEEVQPSGTLEFFLGTPHWLDALTPPLERHLQSLAVSVKALLAMLAPADAAPGSASAAEAAVPRQRAPVQPEPERPRVVEPDPQPPADEPQLQPQRAWPVPVPKRPERPSRIDWAWLLAIGIVLLSVVATVAPFLLKNAEDADPAEIVISLEVLLGLATAGIGMWRRAWASALAGASALVFWGTLLSITGADHYKWAAAQASLYACVCLPLAGFAVLRLWRRLKGSASANEILWPRLLRDLLLASAALALVAPPVNYFSDIPDVNLVLIGFELSFGIAVTTVAVPRRIWPAILAGTSPIAFWSILLGAGTTSAPRMHYSAAFSLWSGLYAVACAGLVAYALVQLRPHLRDEKSS